MRPEGDGSQEAFNKLIDKYKKATENINIKEDAQSKSKKELDTLNQKGYETWKKEQHDIWKNKNIELRGDFSKDAYFQWKQTLLKPIKVKDGFSERIEMVPNRDALEKLLMEDPERFIFNTIEYDTAESSYPVMMGTGHFHFHYQKNGQTVHYPAPGAKGVPDCGETTLRNLFNLAFADPKSQTFDTGHLKKKISKDLPLFNFYDEKDVGQKTYADVQKDSMRSRWAQIVSNLNKEGETFIHYSEAEGRCNIQAGVDNILAVIERVLGDETFGKIRAENTDLKVRRKLLLDYLFQLLSHDGFTLTWSTQGKDGKKTNDLPENIGNLIITINGYENEYLWEFQQGHFEFNPLSGKGDEKDWRKQQATQLLISEKLKKKDPLIYCLKGLIPYYFDSNFIYKIENSKYAVDKEFLLNSNIAANIFYALPISLSFEKKLEALAWGLKYAPKVVKNLIPQWLETITSLNDPALNNKITFLLLHYPNLLTSNYLTENNIPKTIENYKKSMAQLMKTENPSEYKGLEKFLIESLKEQKWDGISLPSNDLLSLLPNPYFKVYTIDAIKEKNVTLTKILLSIIDKKIEIFKKDHPNIPSIKAITSSNIFTQDEDKNTLLHLAVKSGNVDLVKILINNENSRVFSLSNILNTDGYSPFDLVFFGETSNKEKYYNTEIAKALLDNKDLRNALMDKDILQHQFTNLSGTIFDIIVYKKDEEMMEILLNEEYSLFINKLYEIFVKDNPNRSDIKYFISRIKNKSKKQDEALKIKQDEALKAFGMELDKLKTKLNTLVDARTFAQGIKIINPYLKNEDTKKIILLKYQEVCKALESCSQGLTRNNVACMSNYYHLLLSSTLIQGDADMMKQAFIKSIVLRATSLKALRAQNNKVPPASINLNSTEIDKIAASIKKDINTIKEEIQSIPTVNDEQLEHIYKESMPEIKVKVEGH